MRAAHNEPNIKEASKLSARNPLFSVCQREDCEGSLFADKSSKYNYVNIQHFPKYVIIYNDVILPPKLIKICNYIRLFTGVSRSAALRCR